MNLLLVRGGQFSPASGGQFGPAATGQFDPALAGQFDRRFQLSKPKLK
jgi:hypothetical protein